MSAKARALRGGAFVFSVAVGLGLAAGWLGCGKNTDRGDDTPAGGDGGDDSTPAAGGVKGHAGSGGHAASGGSVGSDGGSGGIAPPDSGSSGGSGDGGMGGGEPDASSGSGGQDLTDGATPDDAGSGGSAGATASGPVLLVTGTDPQPAPDNGMKAELTALGLKFDFHNSDTMPLTLQTAAGHSLVIISPNTPHANVPGSYKDLTIPIIVSTDGPAMQLMMANGPYTTDNDQKSINIVAAGDPLAAGFPNGVVSVMGAVNRMVNGMPSADAKVVATLAGGKAATIFYYTAGQSMIGGFKAPAKRVGFFWHRTEDATANGRKLFSAAVQWALKP